MKLFTKLKHWQIFFIWIILAVIVFSTMHSKLYILTLLIYLISFTGWIFLIGKFYNRINKKHKVENYKENFWFVLWNISLIPYSFYVFDFYHNNSINPIISILSIAGGFCGGIMTINFSAKAYSQYEKQKDLKFLEYFWNFILIVYLIIAVWIIQPKINKISRNRSTL